MSLAIAATLFLSACGSSEPQTQSVTQEPVIQEEPAVIKNPELETDKIVSVLVELSSYSMDVLTDYMSNVGKTYSIEDFLAKAKEEIATTYEYLDGLENLPDQENSEQYVTSARDVINCVGASWIKARDYLEDFKDEDLQTLESIVSGYPFAVLQFSSDRYAYLSDAGYTEEEVAEIMDSYGLSIIEDPS